MRKLVLLGSLFSCLFAAPAFADEAAVKKMINDYGRAFNARDVDGVAAFWTETGVHIDDDTGERTEGREAIKADIAAAFAANPKARLVGNIERVRFVRPDVASIEGSVTVSSPDADPSNSNFDAVLVAKDGRWMIDSIEETAVKMPENSFDALQELDWLIGSWSDNSEESSVSTVFRWTSNRAFLLRSFAVTYADGTVSDGTQVIGWDPRSGEIRSWSFKSDGSFGDATWSKNGDDWLVQSSQTLADGQAASGTFIYSRLGDDQISIRLIGHEIEGQPQPTGNGVTISRVVEQELTTTADENE